ncbi:MAG: EcsC family protein [Firmicutes bacterium]|nr:EcsC family protein [Bacillota bacterium]
MATFTASPAVIKQWKDMEKKELSFLEKQYEDGIAAISGSINKKIPDKFEGTLKTMFSKAFALVFEKGTAVIEKSYSKDRHNEKYLKNSFMHSIRDNARTMSAFSRHAGLTRAKNVLISGVEGIGLGVFGVALPDIPLFTAMIMKSVYETALSYGYEYESDEERLFILKLIETSALHGEELFRSDKELNRWIHAGRPLNRTMEEQITAASDALAMDLLTSKAIQNIPVLGVLGGSYNVIFINNLTAYADLKYKRRVLFSKMTRGEADSKSGTPGRKKQALPEEERLLHD